MARSVLLDEFTQTYHSHCRRKGVTPLLDPTHACRPGRCTYWQHPRAPLLYMCEASGLIHECGPEACRHAPVETRDADLVCPLTGIVMDSRQPANTFADCERTLTPKEYNPSEQRNSRWNRWEQSALNVLQSTAAIHNRHFVSVCIIVYESLTKKGAVFFSNRVGDFCVFCLAMSYLCKTGVPQAGLPRLSCAQTFPDPHDLPKHKINLTHFNKAVRHLVKWCQTENAKLLFSPMRQVE